MTDDGGTAGRRAVLLGLGGIGVAAAGVAVWSLDLFSTGQLPVPSELDAAPLEVFLEPPGAGPKANPTAIAASLPAPPAMRPQPSPQQGGAAQRTARIPGAPTPRPSGPEPRRRPPLLPNSPPAQGAPVQRQAAVIGPPTPRPMPAPPFTSAVPAIAAPPAAPEEPPPRVVSVPQPAPISRPAPVPPASPPQQFTAPRPVAVEPQLAAVVRPNVAPTATRRLALYNTHTLETFDAVYWRNGNFDPEALQRLNWFLRDHYANKVAQIDPEVFDLLYVVQAKLGTREPFRIISGYRSPTTNAMLRSESSNVALHSYHMKGKAVDVALADRYPTAIAQCATGLRCGGVGTYRASGFVHLDVGPVRYWYA